MTVKHTLTAIAASLALAGVSGSALAAATIQINNINGPGVGFNDTTPAAPVGGNPGTTLGQQRLNAFTFAANIWGATLNSNVTILINAQFTALACTATSATLGSAGATQVFSDFPNAPRSGTWYSYALANKLAGSDQGAGAPQINARFNSNLGAANCLTGTPFYLGYDNNHGSAVDFVTVLLHEMGHGLGFQTFTSGASGAQLVGNDNLPRPSVWDHTMVDITTNKTWVQMTNAERAASAIKPQKLVWTGAGVTAAVPSVLATGTPELAVSAPAAAIATYLVGTASYGPALNSTGVQAEIAQVIDQADGVTGLACNPLSAANAAAVNGKIALVDRGTCSFAIKTGNAQTAGAVGVIVADNAPGSPPAGLGASGTPVDATITIPSVRITQDDGKALKVNLSKRTRGKTAGVIGKLDLNPAGIQGADASSRALLYTPNPFISGSSVSHYDVSATPNLLMEPSINADLSHSPTLPQDLTYRLLQDIGW